MTLESIKTKLKESPKTWFLSGCAGFVGSHLLQHLLDCGQRVVGVDNLSTGSEENLEAVKSLVGYEAFQNFEFRKMDIRDLSQAQGLFVGVDVVLHQAAMASVPQSVEFPFAAFENNVLGTEMVFEEARKASVKKVIYASSSAIYGDNEDPEKTEKNIGKPLSPYANTKHINELQAEQISNVFGIPSFGLRYFNVFGVRQSPNGPYAAVIPAWMQAFTLGQPVKVYGDGEQTRDFIHVEDVVKANLLAAISQSDQKESHALNVAGGKAISLLDLHKTMAKAFLEIYPDGKVLEPCFESERSGDIRHSLGSIEALTKSLDFSHEVSLETGLTEMFRLAKEN
ncbi:MAG: NAD-dependent epimerase/dehydratase family protein [Pseudomonadota bacterium]